MRFGLSAACTRVVLTTGSGIREGPPSFCPPFGIAVSGRWCRWSSQEFFKSAMGPVSPGAAGLATLLLRVCLGVMGYFPANRLFPPATTQASRSTTSAAASTLTDPTPAHRLSGLSSVGRVHPGPRVSPIADARLPR
jgi:hypothetical protein